MINNQSPCSPPEIPTLIRTLYQVCNKLNNCLPITEQIQINSSIESLSVGLVKITENIILAIHGYEHILQNLQDSLRKHIKNEIQLKLYYEHLEDVITNLKKQRDRNCEVIGSLQTELTVLKDKQKYYLMTTSNNNTRHNEDAHVETKLDTIARIKNRLSLNGTQEFYTSYLAKKMEKESDTKQLRDKRQSLANALKQLYESPIQNKQQERKQQKQVIKFKSKQPQQKQKSKSKQHTSSNQSLNKSKSRRSLNSSLKSTDRQRPVRENSKKIKDKKQDKQKQRVRDREKQKDYLKQTFNNISSRRNSKS